MAYRRGKQNKTPGPALEGQRVQPDNVDSRPANNANPRPIEGGRLRAPAIRGGFVCLPREDINARNDTVMKSLLNPQSSIWEPVDITVPKASVAVASQHADVSKPSVGNHPFGENYDGSALLNGCGATPDNANVQHNVNDMVGFAAQDVNGAASAQIPISAAVNGSFGSEAQSSSVGSTVLNSFSTIYASECCQERETANTNHDAHDNNALLSAAAVTMESTIIQGNSMPYSTSNPSISGCHNSSSAEQQNVGLSNTCANSAVAYNGTPATKARAYTIAAVDIGENTGSIFEKMTFELLNKTLRGTDDQKSGAT
ncbi:hypothetical protein DCS_04038 [Drechmeria coniospora]|uniref:Uncharacterized protein n=1 Tax=Drechmeria coniospora TaxID=98403 RepID=A0A151GJ06_DRECN|nr:hypothetical protein DCS_04038 [Drechmeria coniospora]KYK57031.1 hypothetical protein DCS_04038 [Drechmeria coniospora]